MATNKISIEVAFAMPNKQVIIQLEVDPETSILEAITQSEISKQIPHPILDNINESTPIGIFGKKVDITTYKLRDKDRIEIYRPLNKTPNQKRLERAKNQ